MDNKPKLHELTQDEYYNLINHGTLWVHYPEANGVYYVDVTVPNACGKTLKDLEDDMWKCIKGVENDKLVMGEWDTNPYIGVDYDPSDWVTTTTSTIESKEEKEKEKSHAHYYKEWHGQLDVYRILKLYEVTDPCIQHAVKKLLCSGDRGHKDFKKDIEDSIDSLVRLLEMLDEEENQ